MEGIDVHGDKGRIDWGKVRRSGVTFAFVKATEGFTFVDARIKANLAEATQAGILVGPYHFARPDLHPGASGATGEAANFIRVCKASGYDKSIHARPVLDLEDGSGDLTGWALAFMLKVENELGVRPILYTYSSFAFSYLSHGRYVKDVAKYPLWLANYGPNDGMRHPVPIPVGWSSLVAHQYTSNGSTPGVSGRCDRNFAADIVPLMATAVKPPVPPELRGQEMWAWIRWWRGRGEYKPFGPRNRAVRPDVARPVPKKWWTRLKRNLGIKPPDSGSGTPRSL